jgi:hypothetical protein
LTAFFSEKKMAGTVTQTFELESFNQQQVVKVAWTSDASGNADGTVALTGFIMRVITVPAGGGSAPTDNYDMVFQTPNASSIDLMQGLLANRDTANAEAIEFCSTGGLTNGPPIYANGPYTLSVTNAGNAKSGTIYIYLAK